MEGKTPNPAIEMSKPTESIVKALESKCPANRSTYHDFVLQPLCEGWRKYSMAAGIHTWTTSCLHLHYPPSEEYQSASRFLDKLKARLGDDDQFHYFCKVLNRCNRRHPASRNQFANWARSLIGDDLDLLREFNQYFPYDF